jgi:hypothetical protein
MTSRLHRGAAVKLEVAELRPGDSELGRLQHRLKWVAC